MKSEARRKKDKRTIWLTVIAIAVMIGGTAIESAYAHRTRYGGADEDASVTNLSVTNVTDVTNLSVTNITDVTNLSVTNITEVTDIIVGDGGTVRLTGQGGKIAFQDLTTDIVSIENSLLQLQQQVDNFPIVDTTIIGTLEIYGDDDTADADTVAFSIVATGTSTWTDGNEDSKAVMGVINNGVMNVNQLVLNTDGTTAISTLSTANPIQGLPQHLRFNIFDPLAIQTLDTQVCIIPVTAAASTFTNIKIALDATGNEIAGDLKYADTFAAFANPVVINVCDTTSGVLDDSAMGTAAVPAGKCVYFQFDSAPHTDITQMSWDITRDYD